MMLTRWVVIHESYGLPRAAQELRRYLESQGIRVKITTNKRKSGFVYRLLVAAKQKEQAVRYLQHFRNR